MAGPWEKYGAQPAAPPADGPWSKYAPAGAKPAADILAAAGEPVAASMGFHEPVGAPVDPNSIASRAANFFSPEQAKKDLGTANDAVRHLGNFLTFGTADKLEGLSEAPFRGTDATTEIAKQRAATAAADERLGASKYAVDALGLGMGGGLFKGAPLIGEAAASLGGRVLQGMGIGAGSGALAGAGNDDSGWSKQKLMAALTGGGEGLAVGGILPMATHGLGAAYNFAAPYMKPAIDGMSRRASGALANVVGADTRGAPALAGLGDEAMLLDAGPSARGLAQGVALKPGDGRSRLVDALTDRNNLRNDRLEADLTQNFGPYQDPELFKQGIGQQASDKAGPLYRQGLDTAAPMDAAPIVQNLGKTAEPLTASGRGTINGVASEVKDALGAKDPTIAAERLFNLRKQLDKQIVYKPEDFAALSSADKAAQFALQEARKHVDGALKSIPGFPEADAIYTAASKQKQAADLGYNMLDKGKFATSPDINAQNLTAMSPEEIAAAQVGGRGRLGNIVGTNVNDLAALKSAYGQGGDWNNAKMGQLFGEQPRDAFGNAIDRETKFAKSYNDVVEGSQTAPRAAAKELVDDTTFSGLPNLVDLPTVAINKIVNALMSHSGEGVRSEIANALTQKGGARDRLLEALMSAQRARASQVDTIRGLAQSPYVGALLPAPRSATSQ